MATVWRLLAALEKGKERAIEGLISTPKCLAWKGDMSLPFTAHWLETITWHYSIQEISGCVGLLCAQNKESQKYLMNFVLCWNFHEQNKAIKLHVSSGEKKKNDTKFRDRGMALLRKESLFFLSPLLMSEDDLCSPLGWDSPFFCWLAMISAPVSPIFFH